MACSSVAARRRRSGGDGDPRTEQGSQHGHGEERPFEHRDHRDRAKAAVAPAGSGGGWGRRRHRRHATSGCTPARVIPVHVTAVVPTSGCA